MDQAPIPRQHANGPGLLRSAPGNVIPEPAGSRAVRASMGMDTLALLVGRSIAAGTAALRTLMLVRFLFVANVALTSPQLLRPLVSPNSV